MLPEMPPELRSFFPNPFWNWWQAFKSWALTVQSGSGVPGPTGPTGPAGPAGSAGPAGPGVPTAGLTDQVLAKKSNANYDTEWVDMATDLLAGYRISDIDTGGDPNYYGFEDKNGSWYIMEYGVAAETFRYITGASGYATAWAGRVGPTYLLFENAF